MAATYTSAAKLEATRVDAPPIDLIDGRELANLLETYGLGVQLEMVEQVVIDADYFRSI